MAIDPKYIIRESEVVSRRFTIESENDIPDRALTFGFCINQNDYNGISKIIPCNYNRYMKHLNKEIEKSPSTFLEKPYPKYGYITSRVRKHILRRKDEYLMTLDCDSTEDKDVAIEWLDNAGITYFCVRSSLDSYWIICDKIGRVSELCEYMEQIPGVDSKYLKCSIDQDILLLRAFPKAGFVPKLSSTKGLRGSGEFMEWIMNFKRFWTSKRMEQISEILFTEAI